MTKKTMRGVADPVFRRVRTLPRKSLLIHWGDGHRGADGVFRRYPRETESGTVLGYYITSKGRVMLVSWDHDPHHPQRWLDEFLRPIARRKPCAG